METHVIDESNIKDWRTEIPNSVIKGSKSEISVYAKWLYVYLKSVTGEHGKCWQSTKTIAKGSGISAGKVSSCKKELQKAELITIEKGDVKEGNSDTIRIKDIWASNILEFQKSYTRSRDERPHSCDEHTRSRDESKKNPTKKEPYKEEGESKLSNIPELSEVKGYFSDNGYTEQSAEKFYNYYQASVEGTKKKYWRDSKGNKVRNWKQKAQAVWFKPENEQSDESDLFDNNKMRKINAGH